MSEQVDPQAAPGELATLAAYNAGREVLCDLETRAFTRASVEQLSGLVEGEAIVLLPLAAEVAAGEQISDTPITDTLQVTAYIRGAISRLDPKPPVDGHEKIRHELDWQAVQRVIRQKFSEDAALATAGPEGGYRDLERTTTDWYLHGPGRPMIETRYAPDSAKNLIVFGAPGGRRSPINRQALLLASLAGGEFRARRGLTTVEEGITLRGEDNYDEGWLGNAAFHDELRAVARERIAQGEITPTILFGGSADDKRVLKAAKPGAKEPGELEIVQEYLVPEVALLYPEKGVLEADAMLAAALRVWDGDPGTIIVEDLPVAPGQFPGKLVKFESSLGLTVTGIFTTGEEARIRGQLNRLALHDPDIFRDKDGIAMGTTAIYTPSERPILLEFGIAQGFSPASLYCLGHSSHAAAMPRDIWSLVGEQAKGLRAIENIARRAGVTAEGFTTRAGGMILHGAGITTE